MRKLIVSLVLGGIVAAIATLGGCPAAHDDYPGLACKVNGDCYQGEICNGSVCVPNADMSIVGDFGHPPFDFSSTDLLPSNDDLLSVDM